VFNVYSQIAINRYLVGLRNVLPLKYVFSRNGLRAKWLSSEKRGGFFAIFPEAVFLNIYCMARASRRLASGLCEQTPEGWQAASLNITNLLGSILAYHGAWPNAG